MAEQAGSDLRVGGRVRRITEITVFVGVWMALGFVFHLEVDAYLLLGVPLTLVFQRLVRRAPVRALWLRDAPPFRLNRAGVLIALALMIVPGGILISTIGRTGQRVLSGYALMAVIGAFAAAYAVRSARRGTVRWLLLCLATAGGVAVAPMLLGAVGLRAHRPPVEMLQIGVGSFAVYLPVVFVLEEVTFRGALDAHVQRSGEPREILSAAYVSAIWGLWHYPIAAAGDPLATVRLLLLFHIPTGVFLSIYWRRSGNLLVPGVAHAFIDSVRDAILLNI